jgi:alkanesulfonate monooxygenase SsuD/methylene tetrahydromethanopterin reductase-like flavin-dependent oxidoreductase (luciferase family)
MDELEAHNGITDMGAVPHLAGSPEQVADAIRPYRDLGFSTVIVRMPAPYDRETIERMGEVRAILER